MFSSWSSLLQCDAEVNFLEGQIGLPPSSSAASTNPSSRSYVQPGSQLEMVLAEARRLEEAAHRNEDELRQLVLEQQRGATGAGVVPADMEEDPNLRAEIMQLKQRLAGTDQELQKTNQTLRWFLKHRVLLLRNDRKFNFPPFVKKSYIFYEGLSTFL